MSLWNFIETVIDWIFHWRLNVCVIAGVTLAVLAASNISFEPLRWTAVGIILVVSVVVGWKWENVS